MANKGAWVVFPRGSFQICLSRVECPCMFYVSRFWIELWGRQLKVPKFSVAKKSVKSITIFILLKIINVLRAVLVGGHWFW